MDTYPNIILYDILKKYIIDNINLHDKTNSLFDNIHLINLDFFNDKNFNEQFLSQGFLEELTEQEYSEISKIYNEKMDELSAKNIKKV